MDDTPVYYKKTRQIPGELSRLNMMSFLLRDFVLMASDKPFDNHWVMASLELYYFVPNMFQTLK